MRVFFLSLFLALAALAQQDGFSVDEQGRVWLVKSRQLYSFFTAGLRLEASLISPWGSVIMPGVSSDGNTVCWTEQNNPPRFGGFNAAYTGVVLRRTPFFDARITHPGQVGISRNGKWAVWSKPMDNSFGTLWVNLETGEETPLPDINVSVESVADDGSVVRIWNSGVEVRTPNGTVDRFNPGYANQALISAGARRLFVSSSQPAYVYDRDLKERIQIPDFCRGCAFPVRGFSSDGIRVAFVKDSQAREILLFDTRDGTTRAIPVPEDRPVGLQFSDDGSVLWVRTDGVAILRVDVASGETVAVLPPTPGLRQPPELAAPGARFRVDGAGLAAAIITIRGQPVQITGRGPGWLQLRLPTDLPLGPTEWLLSSPDAPFETYNHSLDVIPQRPQFLQFRDLGESDYTWMPRSLAFAASDGSLINPERPAIAGEELLLWMTGLNGDSGALHWTLWPFGQSRTEQDLTMLGIAPDPDNPGWWIARFRLPDDTPPGEAVVSCATKTHPQLRSYSRFPISSGNSPNIESNK